MTEEIDLAGVVAQLQNENERLRLSITRLSNERSFDWSAAADFIRENYLLLLVAAAWAVVLLSFLDTVMQSTRGKNNHA